MSKNGIENNKIFDQKKKNKLIDSYWRRLCLQEKHF